MKPIYTMDTTQWNMLIQDVADQFDDLTIKRGFQYFKQERVLQFSMPAPQQIEAVVEGKEEYRVGMNLDFFTMSHCNCPVEVNCKHMIAVLLAYANEQGRSVHALVNAKVTALPQQLSKPSPQLPAYRNAVQTAEQKAENTAKWKEKAARIPGMNTAGWHELFELCAAPLANNTRNGQYVQDLLTAISKIKPLLSPVTEQLFALHTRLFVLGKLAKQHQVPTYSSFVGFHTHLAVTDLQESIAHCLAAPIALAAEPEQWPRIADTLSYLRKEMLTKSQTNSHYSGPYYLLWMNWILPNRSDSGLILEELQHLQAAGEEWGDSLSRLPWALAQCWMHLFLSDDQAAWTLLRAADHKRELRSEGLLPFLAYLTKTEEWARLAAWLVEIGPLGGSYWGKSLSGYALYWEEAVNQLPAAEPQMWDTLVRMLPYSGRIYEEKLHEHGRWQQWMDYQLSARSEPLDYRVSMLQPIEKNAPEILLPFYHQAAERYVVQKNRDGYKAAVKLLKRLAKLYKKMKQEDRWELFLGAFTSRHSRLRALQEELRKGKLIP